MEINLNPKNVYLEKLRETSIALEKRNHQILAYLVSLLLQDFVNVMKLGMLTLRGWQNSLRHYNLNPTSLEEFNKEASPTLFIHGQAHNHGVWIPLAKELNKSLPESQPLFTMNYPIGCSDAEAIKILSDKIDQIRQLYRDKNLEPPPINLVGYSNGGDIEIQYLLQNQDKAEQFGKIITVGQPLLENEKKKLDSIGFDRVYDIVAEYDGIEHRKSPLKANRKVTLQETHLGIILSPKLSSHMTDLLKPRVE